MLSRQGKTMKKTVFIFAAVTAVISCTAESSVVTDLRERARSDREWQTSPMSLKERQAYRKNIEDRAWPIVDKEFAKLAAGEVTPLAHELLQDPDAMTLGRPVLKTQIRTYSPDTKTKAWSTAFQATPDALRTKIILSFLNEVPKEAFYTSEVQKWLVGKINGGTPAGVYYFILTDESASAVEETAKTSMRRFSKAREHSVGNLFSLLSAVFLASRGDGDALKLLDSLLDRRDINSLLDTAYVIPAAAMTGNERLIRKVSGIITTDNHSKFDDHTDTVWFPFADMAAGMCAIAIEGFPSVDFCWDHKKVEENLAKPRKTVHDWIDKNPKFKIRSDFALSIIGQTRFKSVITEMLKDAKQQSNKK